MQRLSPLTRSNLFLTELLAAEVAARPAAKVAADKRCGPFRVTVWECGECGERWDDESDAAECCSSLGDPRMHDEEGEILCPVCRNGGNSDYHAAANCCLWKDLDAPARWRIADAVEAGASWDEAIAKENT